MNGGIQASLVVGVTSGDLVGSLTDCLALDLPGRMVGRVADGLAITLGR
jgi:hypothetical protein